MAEALEVLEEQGGGPSEETGARAAKGASPQSAPPPMAGMPSFDPAKMEAFANRVFADLSGAVTSVVCALGDRLGLFGVLAANGAMTSDEFAAAAGVAPRYAREWLSALTSAGYIEYEPSTEGFRLPIEHAQILAHEGGMMFMGGAYQQLIGLTKPLGWLAQAFRTGGGVPQDVYDDDLWDGMERMSAGWFENFLVQQWIAALPELEARLERGARVADVGCGRGRALIVLAEAFPRSQLVGYDLFDEVLDHARDAAEERGVADRVRFERRDVAKGLPESFDLITSFNSVHDFVHPRTTLQAIREALATDGCYLVLEASCSEKLEHNVGPMASILYATSVLYNLPVARAQQAEGLGTMGVPESKLRQLCEEAGFSSFRRLPNGTPSGVLYEAKP